MSALRSLIGRGYRNHVHEQIQALIAVLDQVAAGNYDQKLSLPGQTDDFRDLYIALQSMLASTQNRLNRLEEMNSDLEEIVVTRTTELFGSETRFQAVADASGDAIVTTDQNGFIIYLNRAAEIIFDQPLAQIEGHPLTDLIPDLSPAYLHTPPPSPTNPRRNPSKLVQATAQNKIGHRFPVEVSFAPWRAGSKAHYISAIIHDLTVHQLLIDKLANQAADLKNQVDEQTQQLRARLTEAERDKAEDEALLASIGEGVVAVSKTGEVFFANQKFCDLAETPKHQIIGKPYAEVVLLENAKGRPVARSRRPVQLSLRNGQRTSSTSYLFRSGKGRVFPVSITAAPIVVKSGIIGAIDVIRDITKEKEADRLKSEFVSLASHQLRTPATAVKGLLALVIEGYDGDISAAQRKTLRQAFSENELQLRLIDDMLDVAKLDAGEITLAPVPLDLAALVRTVVKEQAQLTRHRRQAVKVTTPRTKPTVLADPLKLQIVLENLLTNASKYTPEGGAIDIKVQAEPSRFIVRIKDNGIGISARDQTNLFKRFSRASNAAKTHTSGSGLGLYLSRKIMDLHGGTIELDSQLGKGSTFTVIIPRSSTNQHKE